MLYNGASGRNGLGMPSALNEPYLRTKGQAFPVRVLARIWTVVLFLVMTAYLAACYVRMIFNASPYWRSTRLKTMIFRDWAEETVPRGVLARWTRMDAAWRDYTEHVLVPLFSAVCTAPKEDIMAHPAEEFLGNVTVSLFEIILAYLIEIRFGGCRLYLVDAGNASLCCDSWRSRYCCATYEERAAYTSRCDHFAHTSRAGCRRKAKDGINSLPDA